jgi:hypothetical protein
MDQPLAERCLDEEAGLLGHPAGGDAADLATPLHEFEMQRVPAGAW